MKRFYWSLVILWLFLFGIFMGEQSLFAESTPKPAYGSSKDYQVFVPGEIVVKFRPNMTLNEINTLNKAHGAKILEENSTSGFYRLDVSEPVEKASISYQAHPAVEYAQPNYIFAEVGEGFITLFDLELTIHRMIPLLRQRFQQLQAKEDLLRSLLNDKLFSQAAKDEDLQSIPEVQREINEAVEKTLAKVYQKRIRQVTVSEKEMMAYYEKNREKFQTPGQIRGQRILVKNKQEAEEILELLKAGADFENLARERSKDPTAQHGGEFGWIGRGRMPPAVEGVVFALSKGKVSGIITTRFGHYIIKVEDKRNPGQPPFSEVKNQVKRGLEATKQKEAVDRKTKELEEKYQVRLHLEFLSEVKAPVTGKIDMQDMDSIKMLREVIKKA
ncbi:MAG: peptidyl-prolyl cis-trans isomerase, partial [Proteobacteria bacterium]|nr:peptidyl-prolyl cis-trans isomerase [Pseudomonadota bacterium]